MASPTLPQRAGSSGANNPLYPQPPDRSPVPAQNGPGSITPPDHAQGFDGKTDLYTASTEAAFPGGSDENKPGEELGAKMLRLVRVASASAETYANFTRKSWDRAYRAFRNQHFDGSKYNSKEYLARSKHFRPKTRSAVRRAMAGTASSLFSTVDAIAIQPGNEADPNSRAGADLMQEIVNYRTDRTSGKNAIPWFKTAMGATQDAQLTGICVSKQYWKLQTKEVGQQPVIEQDPKTGEDVEVWEQDAATGQMTQSMQPVLKTVFDRPDCLCLPPEQVLIDSGADWTDPAQSAAFLILKWPMKIDDIREREEDPRDPWKHLEDSVLNGAGNDRTTGKAQSIRTSREGGTDRFDSYNQANEFATIWVWECFVRCDGEDYTFFSIGCNHLLSDPKGVEEQYPWNDGERPIVIGYGSLESHKIFPMAPAESWQQMQSEINDLANLTLDTVKMTIAPIAKVKRGRQVELDKLRTRSPGTNLLMTDLTDVEFDKPPGVDAGAWQQMERLNNDFDTLAGQFDPGSVQSNRQLNDTVGGMRLISGAANTMQEFDQRVFMETWAEPVIGQIVKLCQYYEHDQTILGLCGERAKLWEKHGVSQITDALLEAQITTRIDIGIGAGDPQQRIAKFAMAANVIEPIVQGHPKFISGEYEIDVENTFAEVFGAAGYRDGGKRFIKKNPPPGPPPPDPQVEAAAQLAQINAQALQARTEAELQRKRAEQQLKEQQAATDLRIEAMEAQQAAEIERIRAQMEAATKQRAAELDAELARMKARNEAYIADMRAQADIEMKRRAAEAEIERKNMLAEVDRKLAEAAAKSDAERQDKAEKAKAKSQSEQKSEKPAESKGTDHTAVALSAIAAAMTAMTKPKTARKGKDGSWSVE